MCVGVCVCRCVRVCEFGSLTASNRTTPTHVASNRLVLKPSVFVNECMYGLNGSNRIELMCDGGRGITKQCRKSCNNMLLPVG